MSEVESGEDRAVVEAFAAGEAGAYGPTLHLEGEVLMLSGWWHAAVRLAPEVFLVRAEEPREPSSVLELVAEVLTARGLRQVFEAHPLVQPITYSRLSLAGVDFSVWAPHADAAQRAIMAWVQAETLPRDLSPGDLDLVGDWSAEMEGARRTAGLPPSVVLTVGLSPDQARAVEAALPEARFQHRSLEELEPDACGQLRPTVVLIDATGQGGREFAMELRAAACGRFLPVAALTTDPDPPLGADVALDPEGHVGEWRDRLVGFL